MKKALLYFMAALLCFCLILENFRGDSSWRQDPLLGEDGVYTKFVGGINDFGDWCISVIGSSLTFLFGEGDYTVPSGTNYNFNRFVKLELDGYLFYYGLTEDYDYVHLPFGSDQNYGRSFSVDGLIFLGSTDPEVSSSRVYAQRRMNGIFMYCYEFYNSSGELLHDFSSLGAPNTLPSVSFSEVVFT